MREGSTSSPPLKFGYNLELRVGKCRYMHNLSSAGKKSWQRKTLSQRDVDYVSSRLGIFSHLEIDVDRAESGGGA